MRQSEKAFALTDAGDATLTLHLTPKDRAASPWLHVPLDISCDTNALTIALSYAKTPNSVIDLGLLDTEASPFPTRTGFRGWSGGARNIVSITPDTATPGYVPGAIPWGRWHVMLGLYRIPAQGVSVTLRAATRVEAPLAPPRWPDAPAPALTPGWLRGDCHAHTFHSDAKGSAEQLLAAARRQSLDFLFLTDHNTMTGWNQAFRAGAEDMLLLPGMEVTTERGHANLLGATRWVDFRIERPGDIHVLAREAEAAGAVLSINHDKPPIPWSMPLPRITCMEVWHGRWEDGNAVTLARYDARLQAGLRITAIGGSDHHQPDSDSDMPDQGLGYPTTALHVKQADRQGVLNALRRGEAYVTESPTGPHLEMSVNGTPMGGALPSSAGKALDLTLRNAAGTWLMLIGDGSLVAEQPILSADWTGQIALPAGLKYVRAELRDGAAGAPMRCLGNPIYFRGAAEETGLSDPDKPIQPAHRGGTS